MEDVLEVGRGSAPKTVRFVMRPHLFQIMVNFGGETKSSATHPFAPHLVAMIDWNDAESTKPTSDILQRLMTWKSGTLTACTTKHLEAIFRKPQFLPHPACVAEQRKLSNIRTLPLFTAHSLKRGAQVLLWRAVAEGRLNVSLVPLLGKHQTQMQIPQESIRYGQSCLTIIRPQTYQQDGRSTFVFGNRRGRSRMGRSSHSGGNRRSLNGRGAMDKIGTSQGDQRKGDTCSDACR